MEYPKLHGKRPLSVDIKGNNEINLKEVLDIFNQKDYLKSYKQRMEAAFQIGPDVFNLTMVDEDARNELLNENPKIQHNGKSYTLMKPRDQPSVINIRAVPSEASSESVAKALDQWKAGVIVGIKKLYHKGLNLHNGYRSVAMVEYESGKLPAFINIDGASCKVYTPTVEKRAQPPKICTKCNRNGHLATNCKTAQCDKCHKTGHTRVQCEELEKEFPALGNVQKHTVNSETEKNLTSDVESEEQDKKQNTGEAANEMIEEVLEGLSSSSGTSDSEEVDDTEDSETKVTTPKRNDGFTPVENKNKRKRRSAERRRSNSKKRNVNSSIENK